MKERRIVVICPGARSPFVVQDAGTLGSRYPTDILGLDMLPTPRKFFLLLRLLRLLLAREILLVVLFFSVPTYAPFVVWLSRAFRRKVVVIAGGYDTTYVPSIDWGEMKQWWKRALQRVALAGVDLALPFSNFSKSEVLRWGRPKVVETLYFGIDTERFRPSGPKEDLVLTVCYQVTASTLVQKGLSTFIECARRIPEARFVLIGRTSDEPAVCRAKAEAPPNVVFCDEFIPDNDLLNYYQRAKVYVQASAHEGFGIANAEAMACGCVPVGTLQTSLPEVIGDAGLCVPFNDIAATEQAIRTALRSPELGERARARIVRNFPAGIRERTLLHHVGNLLGSPAASTNPDH